MHQDANTGHDLCTLVRVSRRRKHRTGGKGRRQAPSATEAFRSAVTGVRQATHVDRLTYTRTQAADALGVSRSTFDRRVLPLLETVDMPWGTRLVPVDELERLVDERRRRARGRAQTASPGRRSAVPEELVRHIQAEHARGASIRRIARDLNASQTPTAQGGALWWPSTVRAVLRRAEG